MVYRCKECGYRGSFVVESDGGQGAGSKAVGLETGDRSGEDMKPGIPLWVRVLAVLFVVVVILYRF
jgi:hypothetical protein